MEDKLSTVFLYIVIGIFIAVIPACLNSSVNFFIFFNKSLVRVKKSVLWEPLAIIFIALTTLHLVDIATISVSTILFFISIAVCLIFISNHIYISTANIKSSIYSSIFLFNIFCVSMTLLWWKLPAGRLSFSYLEMVYFGVTTAFCFYGISSFFLISKASRAHEIPTIWLFLYSAIVFILSFSTGLIIDGNVDTLWHHWGAYIGPAELLLSGATIFHDFPAQYGFGPTLLIAGACSVDCWTGMYYVSGFTLMFYGISIAFLALGLINQNWQSRLVVLFLCLVACFFWTAFPPKVSSPLHTPSIGGLRFLPSLLIASFLFFVDKIENSNRKLFYAHCMWVFGALWSPESAFYVSFIWWPYYLHIKRIKLIPGIQIRNMLHSIGVLLFIALVTGVLFFITLKFIFGNGPSLTAYLAYVLSPPGPLPINPRGAIWFFVVTIAIGFCALLKSWQNERDSHLFRRGLVVILLCYAVFSYFLGRSHDNNLLNIIPFMLLLLLFTTSTFQGHRLGIASTAMIASMLGSTVFFGWQDWKLNTRENRILSFQTPALLDFLVFKDDAGQAIKFIRENYGEPVTILNNSMNLVRSIPPHPWSVIHGPANLVYIPPMQRKNFMLHTSKALQRPGWVVINEDFDARAWLADFDSAYRRTDRVVFGKYYAIRFAPIFDSVSD